MAAVTVSPTVFPSCEMVLNTPPASACDSGGNARQMTRLDTVQSTKRDYTSAYALVLWTDSKGSLTVTGNGTQ